MPISSDWWRKRRRKGFWIKCFVIFAICFSISVFVASQFLPDFLRSEIVGAISRKEELEQEYLLLILLLTSPKNSDRRSAIRETWLRNIPGDFKYFFVIGVKDLEANELSNVKSEQRKHDDMLLLPQIRDSYAKLTDKLVEAFKWTASNVKFSFVLKADDDTFARLGVLKNELTLRVPQRIYHGFFDGRARIKKSGQWAEPNWVLCDRYLPHARGGGYILSYDLVVYIAKNAEFLQRFNSEDISVGAWLAPLDIQRIHDPRFDTEYISRGCNNRYVVTHKQDENMMRLKQKNIDDGRPLCDKEVQLRTSYVYNWKAIPSLCCIRNDSSVP